MFCLVFFLLILVACILFLCQHVGALARVAVNDLVEKAWVELDGDIIDYKEYQEIHRGTFDQDVTDISRLVEQVTDLECLETEAVEGISKTGTRIQAEENQIYDHNFAKINEELTRRQKDLESFRSLLSRDARMQHPHCRAA